ncbi:MAG: methylmalonyl-CoA mutase, partial [Deltaproteobacteria bacterium]|nr:methylmalonyl-CoA mutase [Deltaproteobacteria bacterium]
SGAHMTHFPRVLESLKQLGEEIPVFGGGIIPDEDIIELKKMGVKEIFVPGTSLQDIVDWVKNNIKKKTTLKIQ